MLRLILPHDVQEGKSSCGGNFDRGPVGNVLVGLNCLESFSAP